MDALHYKDFDLDIDPGAGRHYPVRILTSPAGQARATMVFPFDAEELKERLAALEEAVTGYADSASGIQNFGTRLSDALFTGDVRLAYERSRQATLERGLTQRFRAWLAQVLAVEPGRPNDGLVELSAGTERDKPWHARCREFSNAPWRYG